MAKYHRIPYQLKIGAAHAHEGDVERGWRLELDRERTAETGRGARDW